MPLGEEVSLELTPQKVVILLLLARIVKTVVDGYRFLHIITSTGDWLFKFLNIDDLEQP